MSERLLEEERLDELLWMFEPEPPDNGFTQRVMTRIHKPTVPYRLPRSPRFLWRSRLGSWRRFITRPIALAGAILLLMGVAYAAIVTTSPTTLSSKEEARQRPQPGDERKASDGTDRGTARSKTQASSSPSPTMRNGTTEYGYISSHTAYVEDQGLRLETETYVNELKIDKQHKVQLTLQNLTNERIVVYAQKGCLLSVSLAKNQKESSTSEESSTGSVVCASPDGSSGSYPSKSEGEYTVLEPHSKRVEYALITASESGDWQVVGLCSCYNRSKSSPLPSPSPRLNPELPLEFRLTEPMVGRTPPPQEGYGRMFTPPIKMVAN